MNYLPIFWGMHLIWWFFWLVLLFWIFATPYDIPGSRKSKNTALEILKRRFANGLLTAQEYKQKKAILME